MKKIALMLTLLVFSFCFLCDAAGITKYEPLNKSAFWEKQNNDGNKVVLSEQQINEFNKAIRRKTPFVVDLEKYPNKLQASNVKKLIEGKNQLLKDSLYLRSVKISDSYKKIIKDEMNVANIPSEVTIKYGVLLNRTNLRAFPTNEAWFASSLDTQFDLLQETVLDPSEPVVVLHKSKSGNFYYIQAKNYSGWIAAWDIVFTDKETWLKYVNPKNFLIVTTNKYILKDGNRTLLYQMGAKLPIKETKDKKHKVLVPYSVNNRQLAEKTIVLSESSVLHRGFLSFTSNNILKQAFAFAGDPYGWGGLNNSVDCSSFIVNVYRTFGVELPRDTYDQEETAGVRIMFDGIDNEKDRLAFFGTAIKPGDVLFFDGHAMLYVGMIKDIPYIIHALSSYYEKGEKKRPMQVVVSDLTLQRSNGKTFLENLTSSVSYK